jgi:hypothetical protein
MLAFFGVGLVTGVVVGAIAASLFQRRRTERVNVEREAAERLIGRRGVPICDVMDESANLPTDFEMNPLVWGTEIQDDIDKADADEREGIIRGVGVAGNEH